MKKIFTGLFLVIIIFAGVNFGINAVNSTKTTDSVLPSVAINNTADEEVETKPAPAAPLTLKIQKINVEATIESVGLDNERKMDIPKDSDNVAWYNLGPKPGESGSAVIAGHKDEKDGSPSVFWDIKKLQAGDEIIIADAAGTERTFSVVKKEEYPDANFPLQKVFNAPGGSFLNLITCEGVWNSNTRNYSHRTVVYSQLVE